MEGQVRVTVSGPVLATLILAGWLELQGAPPWHEATDPLESGGTMELRTETTEYWVELPCEMVYDLTSDARGPKRATLGRANAKGLQVATYLLQLEVSGAE